MGLPHVDHVSAVKSPTLIAIAVVEQDDHFLIGRRAADVPLAGLWEFPGGKVEPNETPAQAAVRECQEEAGVGVEAIETYSVQDFAYDHGQLRLHFFACRPIERMPIPIHPFRWVSRADMLQLEFPRANQVLLEQLAGHPIRNQI